jgi:hypothetical protein
MVEASVRSGTSGKRPDAAGEGIDQLATSTSQIAGSRPNVCRAGRTRGVHESIRRWMATQQPRRVHDRPPTGPQRGPNARCKPETAALPRRGAHFGPAALPGTPERRIVGPQEPASGESRFKDDLFVSYSHGAFAGRYGPVRFDRWLTSSSVAAAPTMVRRTPSSLADARSSELVRLPEQEPEERDSR